MSSHAQTELYFTDKTHQMMAAMPAYVKTYIRAIHNNTSPRTRYEYLKDIEMFLDYLKDNLQTKVITADNLDSLTKEDFEDYFEHLEHYQKNGQQRTNGRKSIARKLSSLRRFFAYLFESELISSDEIRKIAMPKVYHKEIIRMEADETSDFLSAVENGSKMTPQQLAYHKKQSERDAAIVYLMLSTGIRVSECAEIDIADVDIPHHCIRITRKGGNEATVYFSDEASVYLEKYLETRKAMKGLENEPALFLSSRQKRMGVRSIEILIKKYAKRSVPGKKITPHKLRSTFATNLYNETGDIYLVAETLGHRDVTTTKEHYANLSNRRKEEARNKIALKKTTPKDPAP